MKQNNTINKEWDKRSKLYGDDIKGVLFKSFPLVVNNHLDRWMSTQILNSTSDNTRKVLDVGCGYGRLSEPLLQKIPSVRTWGVDIADTYVALYNKRLNPRGRAVTADTRSLPFKDEYFDIVFVVTTLMYITSHAEQQKAVSELLRVVRPGGRIVFIERNPSGFTLLNMGGIVRWIRGTKNKEIPAVGFTAKQIQNLLTDNNATLEHKSGIPVFTVILPIFVFVSILSSKVGAIFSKLINSADRKLSSFYGPSLYIAYHGYKNK